MPYDKEHRIARNETINDRGYQCEVTGDTTEIEAHHVVPRSFDGPDMKENYQLLQKEFHKKIHEVTKTTHPQLHYERQHIKRSLLKNPDNEQYRERIRAIDNDIMPEYIGRLIRDLPEEYQKLVIEQTMVSNFHTIRELTIELLSVRKQLEEATTPQNIIQMRGFSKHKRRRR